MPRYFFVVHQSDRTSVLDLEGCEYNSTSAALEEASLAGREILADAIDHDHEAPIAIAVWDEDGSKVGFVHLEHVLPRDLQETGINSSN